MKLLYILAFLLAGLKPAISDSTLTFKNFSDTGSQSNSYYLKDNQLRMLEEHSDLFNIYNRKQQYFSSLNTQTGAVSRIDADIINQRVERLNQQRMEKLAELEKQLAPRIKDMSKEEKKASESLLNQLKYPEYYGSHMFLKIHNTTQQKSINGINCTVYEVMREDQILKKICIADNQALKLDTSNYDTLRDFQHFNYTTQTRLMLAAGKTNFTHIDYQQEKINGIPIEIINTSGNTENCK